jgi:hypothetical protein
MLSVEYMKDDVLAKDESEKCKLCKFKYVVSTTCCGIKLCGFHVRDNGEHADKQYFSCEGCITHEPVEKQYLKCNGYSKCDEYVTYENNVDNGYLRINNAVYCDKCEEFYCKDHINHECLEWVTLSPPVFPTGYVFHDI